MTDLEVLESNDSIVLMTHLKHASFFFFFMQTPNTLRSKLQEKLINTFDTNEIAGTIASIKSSVKTSEPPSAAAAAQSDKPSQDDSSGTGESEISLPPIQPGPRKRRTSRGGIFGDDGPSDKIDIDSENIETPPVTRRAHGSRPFSVPSASLSMTSGEPSAPSASVQIVRGQQKCEDEELGDGRFDRFSSVRRTRRLRKAPEGAEEDALEPRKSPEGVENTEDMSPPDVIVGMEVKKVSQAF